MHRAHSWTNDCWANQLIFVLHFDAPCVQCRGVRLETSWRRSTTQYRAGTVRKLSCCRSTAAWGTMFPKLSSRKPRKENDGRTQVSVISGNFHCSPVLGWRELWVSLTSYILMEWYSLITCHESWHGRTGTMSSTSFLIAERREFGDVHVPMESNGEEKIR